MTRLDSEDRLHVLNACGLTDGTVESPQLDRLAELAIAAIDVPVSLVSLVTPTKQRFAGQIGLKEPWASRRETPLSHSFCQFVVLDDAPVMIQDARTDSRVAGNPAITDLDVIAYLGAPIRGAGGEVLGSFCAIDSEPREWTATDLRLVETLAAAASTEIQQRTRLRDVTLDLQRRLVPDRLPEPGWATLAGTYEALDREGNLGGDFYDVIPHDDDSVTLMLGDVVGHGVDAALVMGQLRAAVGTQLDSGAAPATAVAAADSYVRRRLPGGWASALSLTHVTPEGDLVHLRAGSWPPLVLSPAGSVRFVEGGGSWPLASVEMERVEPHSDRLEVDETLIVFSDGLVESGDTDPAIARSALVSVLSHLGSADLEEINRSLIAHLAPWVSRRDDVAIVSLRREA